MGAGESSRRQRFVTLLVIAVVLAPALLDRDSFPLSTYPIYAHTRARVVTFDTAIGIDVAGSPRRLSMEQIAETDDPLIASSVVSGAVRAGRADELCAEIAARADQSLRSVEVVSERHDTVNWLRGRESLEARTVHATCPVER